MTAPVRRIRRGTINGRLTPITVHDGKGTAHILRVTTDGLTTLCGRELEQAGKITYKSCKWCSDRQKENPVTPRLTPAEKEAARHLYLADESLSIAAVAELFGVGPTVMRDALVGILRAQGGRPKTTMTTAQMIRMRDQGITLAQIGKQAGISESGVLRRIQRHKAGQPSEMPAKAVC